MATTKKAYYNLRHAYFGNRNPSTFAEALGLIRLDKQKKQAIPYGKEHRLTRDGTIWTFGADGKNGHLFNVPYETSMGLEQRKKIVQYVKEGDFLLISGDETHILRTDRGTERMADRFDNYSEDIIPVLVQVVEKDGDDSLIVLLKAAFLSGEENFTASFPNLSDPNAPMRYIPVIPESIANLTQRVIYGSGDGEARPAKYYEEWATNLKAQFDLPTKGGETLDALLKKKFTRDMGYGTVLTGDAEVLFPTSKKETTPPKTTTAKQFDRVSLTQATESNNLKRFNDIRTVYRMKDNPKKFFIEYRDSYWEQVDTSAQTGVPSVIPEEDKLMQCERASSPEMNLQWLSDAKWTKQLTPNPDFWYQFGTSLEPSEWLDNFWSVQMHSAIVLGRISDVTDTEIRFSKAILITFGTTSVPKYHGEQFVLSRYDAHFMKASSIDDDNLGEALTKLKSTIDPEDDGSRFAMESSFTSLSSLAVLTVRPKKTGPDASESEILREIKAKFEGPSNDDGEEERRKAAAAAEEKRRKDLEEEEEKRRHAAAEAVRREEEEKRDRRKAAEEERKRVEEESRKRRSEEDRRRKEEEEEERNAAAKKREEEEEAARRKKEEEESLSDRKTAEERKQAVEEETKRILEAERKKILEPLKDGLENIKFQLGRVASELEQLAVGLKEFQENTETFHDDWVEKDQYDKNSLSKMKSVLGKRLEFMEAIKQRIDKAQAFEGQFRDIIIKARDEGGLDQDLIIKALVEDIQKTGQKINDNRASCTRYLVKSAGSEIELNLFVVNKNVIKIQEQANVIKKKNASANKRVEMMNNNKRVRSKYVRKAKGCIKDAKKIARESQNSRIETLLFLDAADGIDLTSVVNDVDVNNRFSMGHRKARVEARRSLANAWGAFTQAVAEIDKVEASLEKVIETYPKKKGEEDNGGEEEEDDKKEEEEERKAKEEEERVKEEASKEASKVSLSMEQVLATTKREAEKLRILEEELKAIPSDQPQKAKDLYKDMEKTDKIIDNEDKHAVGLLKRLKRYNTLTAGADKRLDATKNAKIIHNIFLESKAILTEAQLLCNKLSGDHILAQRDKLLKELDSLRQELQSETDPAMKEVLRVKIHAVIRELAINGYTATPGVEEDATKEEEEEEEGEGSSSKDQQQQQEDTRKKTPTPPPSPKKDQQQEDTRKKTPTPPSSPKKDQQQEEETTTPLSPKKDQQQEEEEEEEETKKRTPKEQQQSTTVTLTAPYLLRRFLNAKWYMITEDEEVKRYLRSLDLVRGIPNEENPNRITRIYDENQPKRLSPALSLYRENAGSVSLILRRYTFDQGRQFKWTNDREGEHTDLLLEDFNIKSSSQVWPDRKMVIFYTDRSRGLSARFLCDDNLPRPNLYAEGALLLITLHVTPSLAVKVALKRVEGWHLFAIVVVDSLQKGKFTVTNKDGPGVISTRSL